MKKSTYDALSTVAVVALVVSTIGAQHFRQIGYVFGCLAILSAVGSFVVYVKALPKSNAAGGEAKPLVEGTPHQTPEELVSERVEALLASRKQPHEEGVQLQQLQLFGAGLASDRHSQFDSHVAAYNRLLAKYLLPAQMEVRHGIERDPALIITDVVEKLCASTKEPRFDFIISPNGSFTIRKRSQEEFQSSGSDGGKEENSQLVQ